MSETGHLLSILHSFGMAALFVLCGVVCMMRSRALSGLTLAAAGFFMMAVGEVFLGIARVNLSFIEIGNSAHGMFLALGGVLVLLGLYLVGPKRA